MDNVRTHHGMICAFLCPVHNHIKKRYYKECSISNITTTRTKNMPPNEPNKVNHEEDTVITETKVIFNNEKEEEDCKVSEYSS